MGRFLGKLRKNGAVVPRKKRKMNKLARKKAKINDDANLSLSNSK
jgi:hypothetical protein